MGGGILKNTESQVLQYATDYNQGDVIVRHGKVLFYLHVLGDFSSHGSCAFPFPLLYPIYIDHEEYLHRGLQRADFRFGCLGHRGCSANPERSRARQVEKEKMRIIREKFFSTRGEGKNNITRDYFQGKNNTPFHPELGTTVFPIVIKEAEVYTVFIITTSSMPPVFHKI